MISEIRLIMPLQSEELACDEPRGSSAFLLPAQLESVEQHLDAITAVIPHHLGDVGVAAGGVTVAVAVTAGKDDAPAAYQAVIPT